MFPWHLTEKPRGTFWPIQHFLKQEKGKYGKRAARAEHWRWKQPHVLSAASQQVPLSRGSVGGWAAPWAGHQQAPHCGDSEWRARNQPGSWGRQLLHPWRLRSECTKQDPERNTLCLPGPSCRSSERCVHDVCLQGVNSKLPPGQGLTPTLPPGQRAPCGLLLQRAPGGGGELGAGTRGPITQSGSSGWFPAGAPSTEPPYNCLLNAERAKASQAHESILRTKMCNVYRALIHHLLLQRSWSHFNVLGSFRRMLVVNQEIPLFYYHIFFFFFFPPKLKYVIFCDILKLKGHGLYFYQPRLDFHWYFDFALREKNANTELCRWSNFGLKSPTHLPHSRFVSTSQTTVALG